MPCPSALTVRSETLRQLGGFDETIDMVEDLKLISELSFRFPVYVAARCNSEYRRRRIRCGPQTWRMDVTPPIVVAAGNGFGNLLRGRRNMSRNFSRNSSPACLGQ